MDLKGKLLCDTGDVQVHQAEISDEHELVVVGEYLYLSRGILREWANADSDRIRCGYRALTGEDFVEKYSNRGISLEAFGWALAQARNKELEDEISYWLDKNRKLKNM